MLVNTGVVDGSKCSPAHHVLYCFHAIWHRSLYDKPRSSPPLHLQGIPYPWDCVQDDTRYNHRLSYQECVEYDNPGIQGSFHELHGNMNIPVYCALCRLQPVHYLQLHDRRHSLYWQYFPDNRFPAAYVPDGSSGNLHKSTLYCGGHDS